MRSCFNFIKRQVRNRRLIGAEIGVQNGGNAADILANLNLKRLYLIDSWEGKFESLFENLQKRFEDDRRVVILKNSSLEASQKVTDPLDFVYIDAGHSYGAVKEDLVMWSPKVKVGGFVCGHDYTKRWPGVREAVLEYCSENGICYLVQSDGRRMIDGDFYCNWWFQNSGGYDYSLNKESYVVDMG